MNDLSPLREPQGLQAFRKLLTGDAPGSQTLTSLLEKLESEASLERAFSALKQTHPRTGKQDPWQGIRAILEKAVDHARQIRMSNWQMNPRRRTLRLCLELTGEACRLHPPAVVNALSQALLSAEIPLAMGMEKSPRPMISLGPPLPSGIPGYGEWADVSLREPWAFPLRELPERTLPFAHPGLRILEAAEIPNISSPILELCRVAHWRWECPVALAASAQARMSDFLQSSSYQIQKTGKVDGQKQVKLVEVRPMVISASWTETVMFLSTRVAAGEAMNIQKLLAGILECDVTALDGLERLSVELSEDPRLAQATRYETKLHNIYEDAVLLDGGCGIETQDEDEDDPIVLHRPRKS